jgi:hypothetical protein
MNLLILILIEMKAIEIKQDDITEEMISDLVKFLDSNP